MINPWFKFFGSEYLSDPKISSLSANKRSCWVTLLCLASMSTKKGVVEFLTVETLLEKSGIPLDPYDTTEWENCLDVLKVFEKMRMIDVDDDGTITIKNWEKRQETSMTNAERQSKYRLNKKRNENVTRVTTNVTLEENRIEENRREYNINNNLSNNLGDKKSRVSKKVVTFNPLGAEIIKAFEEVDPKNKTYYNNKTQRSACDFLLAEYGMEDIIKRVSVLPKTNKIPFFPKITCPNDLKEKWVKLNDAVEAKRREAQETKEKYPVI